MITDLISRNGGAAPFAGDSSMNPAHDSDATSESTLSTAGESSCVVTNQNSNASRNNFTFGAGEESPFTDRVNNLVRPSEIGSPGSGSSRQSPQPPTAIMSSPKSTATLERSPIVKHDDNVGTGSLAANGIEDADVANASAMEFSGVTTDSSMRSMSPSGMEGSPSSKSSNSFESESSD